MARRILSAMDYGYRKVIKVVWDDSIPQWIHPLDNGDPHEPGNARGPDLPDGTRGVLDRDLVAGTECHACQQNWVIEDFNFEQGALIMTDQMMLDRITGIFDARAVAPVDMPDLTDRPI